MFEIGSEDKTILFQPELKLLVSCRQTDGIIYSNCTKVPDNVLTSSGCSFQLNIALIKNEMCNLNNHGWFHPVTQKLHMNDEPKFKNCHQDWKSKNIRKEILEWKSHLLKNLDPFWYNASNFAPLDLDHPELDITIPMLVNRKAFTNQKAFIKSNGKTLFEGFVINGTIKGK